jgi:magnesium and cobalt transporter
VGEEITMGDFVFRVTEADDRRVLHFHVTRVSGNGNGNNGA